MKKALVLYSGGLDSRLAVQLFKEQGFEIETIHFNLPFGCTCENLDQKKSIIFDVKKDPLLSEYLKILKAPKFGTGAGINPCKDCKIFMLKKAKEYADKNKIELIATGEVLGQRPMSQISSAMKIIDNELGFEVLRPLSAKILPETSFEKKGLVDRNKLLAIKGRNRKEQIELAKKYKIKYPSPAGGCSLCEKATAERLKHLLEKKLITEKTLPLTIIGRHFFIDDVWFVVARNKQESETILKFENRIEDDKGKPAIYFSKKSGRQKAFELQEAYSTGDNEDKRKKFEEFKL